MIIKDSATITVYRCKYCKDFMISGFINEYDEHFCSKRCYKKYCKRNNYTPDIKSLTEYTSMLG